MDLHLFCIATLPPTRSDLLRKTLKKYPTLVALYRWLRRRTSLSGLGNKWEKSADASTLAKAVLDVERCREILSDPLNLLVDRVPQSGFVEEGKNVILHNGIRVPLRGKFSYYGGFSEILVLNRGVHEPLEEYCFQELLKALPPKSRPTMLELGAYWGHYSMWLKKVFPEATVVLVEPDSRGLQAGKNNFALNGMQGTFMNSFVSEESFTVDSYMATTDFGSLTVLHSDIQGYELEMLRGASLALSKSAVDYVFLSSHSGVLHKNCLSELDKWGYHVEVSSEPEEHSTSFDGFIMARSKFAPPVFRGFSPMGRVEIANASSTTLLEYLAEL